MAITVSVIAAVSSPFQALAKTDLSTVGVTQQALSYATYGAMIDCLRQDSQQTSRDFWGSYGTSDANAKSGNWWNTGASIPLGTTQGAESVPSFLGSNVNTAGNALCNNVLATAVKVWGFSSPLELLCGFVDHRKANGAGGTGPSCQTGTTDFGSFSPFIDNFKSMISTQFYGGAAPSMALDPAQQRAAEFKIYNSALMTGCQLTASAAPNPGFAYNITTVNADGTTTTQSYEGRSEADVISVYSDAGSTVKKNCAELAQLSNDRANDYALVAGDDASKGGGTEAGAGDPNCTSGSDCEEDAKSSCVIDGIGWLICPVVNFMAGIADNAYQFLADNFLSVSPQITQMNDTNPTYVAWKTFLSFGNVVLVIGFLFIIFSQITGVGITNYGVKKTLPKLIVVAILINLSFIICALAVDLSNLLGYSLKSFLASVGGGSAAFAPPGAVNDPSATGEGWVSIAGVILAGGIAGATGVAAAGGITLALVALIGVLAAAVVALVMIFFILMLRQVGVILLIVLAPVAIAAYLLPNLATWTTKWRKALTALLLVFPVIGGVFGASTLASKVIGGVATGTDNFVMSIIAAGVAVIPLFVVPGLLKKSIDGLGTLGGKLSGVGAKLSGAARGKIRDSEYAKHLKSEKAKVAAATRAGIYDYKGKNPFRHARKLLSNVNAGINNSDTFNKLTQGYGNKRTSAIQTLDAEWIRNRADALDTGEAYGKDGSGVDGNGVPVTNATEHYTYAYDALQEKIQSGASRDAIRKARREEAAARRHLIQSEGDRTAFQHIQSLRGGSGAPQSDPSDAAVSPMGSGGGQTTGGVPQGGTGLRSRGAMYQAQADHRDRVRQERKEPEKEPQDIKVDWSWKGFKQGLRDKRSTNEAIIDAATGTTAAERAAPRDPFGDSPGLKHRTLEDMQEEARQNPNNPFDPFK